MTTLGSTVSTVTNYVNNTVTAQPLANVTATTSGVILPLTYSGFSAELKDQFVLISRTAESITPLEGFTVESSADGRNWQNTAVIPADRDQSAYTFRDADLNFSIRYYRIAIADMTGKSIYANVAIVRKATADISLQIISSGSDRVVNFPNATPDGVRLLRFTIQGPSMLPPDSSRFRLQGLMLSRPVSITRPLRPSILAWVQASDCRRRADFFQRQIFSYKWF